MFLFAKRKYLQKHPKKFTFCKVILQTARLNVGFAARCFFYGINIHNDHKLMKDKRQQIKIEKPNIYLYGSTRECVEYDN